jgi:DNA-binding transcriptional regulator YiaG
MTPTELKSIRIGLKLSGAEFARLLGYEGVHMRQMMHELEAGLKRIREPQKRLAEAYRDGYRPSDWPL